MVTNDKFVKDFQTWAEGYDNDIRGSRFKIIDDGSTDDSDKLGAIGDINLVLMREETWRTSDLIVVAGDNLFSEPLTDFAKSREGSEAMLATYDVGDLEAIKKYSSITIDSDGVITQFEEKPAEPKNTLDWNRALLFFARGRAALHDLPRRRK